jgi:hypothetical protein
MRSHVFAIERFISQKIPRVKLENFDYKYTMRCSRKGKPGQPQGRFPRQSARRRVHGGYHFAPGGRRRDCCNGIGGAVLI